MISGATRVAAVIGDPVRHSLSPVLHNTAYRELGLDWAYVAFEVAAGATVEALEAARVLGLVGLSVTMPHKTAAADACDEVSTDARVLHSVNTVTIDGKRLIGDSTDGEGFLRSLHDAGCSPGGRRVLLLGAGGAARAVEHALRRAGAHVEITARRAELATVPWDARAAAVRAADIVVNATPIGMGDDETLPLPVDALHRGQAVVDLVYHPIDTQLLQGARVQGATAVDGLGMLVHQAALQVERWTGMTAPVGAMRAAAEAALKH